MSERQDNKVKDFNTENEFNFYLSMKVLNSIRHLIANSDYLRIKEKLEGKYKPIFALASEI